MNITKYEVPVEKLRWHCDPAIFDFECTKDLAPLREFIGQDRAIRAIEFGLSMTRDGYNIYVSGLTGTGKSSIVKTYIQKLVEKKLDHRLEDWCYLYNFGDPDRPQAVNLPQGKGKSFKDQIVNLLQKLKEELTKAFSSEEYLNQKKKVVEESQTRQQQLIEAMAEEAQHQSFQLQMTTVGPALIPLVEGKPIAQADYLVPDQINTEKTGGKTRRTIKKAAGHF